jgi:hypothetical protein
MIIKKEMEFTFGQTKIFIKDNLRRIRNKGKVN